MIVTWILTIGYCEFCKNLTIELKDILREIGEKIRAMEKMNAAMGKLAKIEMAKKLIEFVSFHSDAKELSVVFCSRVFRQLT